MPRAQLTDVELAYDITGKRGPLVVQLHGLTSSRKRDAQIGLDLGRALRGHHRILRYDARGHGSSTGTPDPETYSWPRLAGDLLALLDQLAPGEAVHGVGTSMGSATLLHAALRAPRRFISLTLVVPPTAWETRKAQSARYLANADLVEAHGVEAFVELGATVPDPPALVGSPHSGPSVVESLLPSAMRGAATSNLPPLQQVAELAVPTLILGWAGDPSHPVRTADLLHTAIANSRQVVARTPFGIMAWPALFADHVTAADEQRRAQVDALVS